MDKIFTEGQIGFVTLKNRIVMALIQSWLLMRRDLSQNT